MPDHEVGQIISDFYPPRIMASFNRPPPIEPVPSREPVQVEHRTQFRPQYREAPSSPQPPSSYAPNTPGHDGRPSPERVQNGSASGSATGQPKRTRTQPTKSCERCRSKKLRCDREFPCGSCKKAGKSGSDCSYRSGWEPWGKDEEVPVAKKAKRDAPAMAGSMTVLEKMVKIGAAMGGTDHGTESPGTAGGTRLPVQKPSYINFSAKSDLYASPSTLGRLDINGPRSRYVAPGDKMSIMDHFGDSKKFITNGFNDPDMVGIMRGLAGYQKILVPKGSKREPRAITSYEREDLMSEMFKAIPDGWLFGVLPAKLFQNWETIHRVLHMPTFSKECEGVATAQVSGAMKIPTNLGDWVLPQILLAVAIVSRLEDPSLKHASSGRITEEQIAWSTLLAKTWLDGLHGKSNICIHTMQTRTMLLIAQQVNLCGSQELWMDSATLVRRAMIMGLHQDPEGYSEMSKLDKEMRRKLWTTIVELDMQFSLAAGMPAAVTSSIFNIKNMINVNDNELTATMVNYPTGKPETTWTTAMPQIALSASLKDRLNITNWLGGNLNMKQDIPALFAHADILERALRSVPMECRGSSVGSNMNNKRIDRLFASIMLDMSIRRPLIAVYRTIVFSPQTSQSPEVRRGALRCALAMLSHLDALDPAIADLSIVKSRDYLNLFHILCKSDIIQAALLICHEIRSFDHGPLSGTATPSTDAAKIEEAFPQTKHSLTRVVENTLHGLLSRLGDFGSDLKDILPLSVVLQSVRAEGTSEEMREVMQRGAERVLTACRGALSGVQFQQSKHEKKLPPPNPPGDTWNSVVLQNGGTNPTPDFSTLSVDDFDFQTFDFGWSAWGMSQS